MEPSPSWGDRNFKEADRDANIFRSPDCPQQITIYAYKAKLNAFILTVGVSVV